MRAKRTTPHQRKVLWFLHKNGGVGRVIPSGTHQTTFEIKKGGVLIQTWGYPELALLAKGYIRRVGDEIDERYEITIKGRLKATRFRRDPMTGEKNPECKALPNAPRA